MALNQYQMKQNAGKSEISGLETHQLFHFIDCRCFGKELKQIPDDLPKNLQRLTITDSDIKNIDRDALQPYKETLMEV